MYKRQVFVQGHLHTEEGRDANNQKVYFVTVTVDYQQIIEKQEFNGLELCTGLPPVSYTHLTDTGSIQRISSKKSQGKKYRRCTLLCPGIYYMQ